MMTATLPEIQGEYDIWNVSPVYTATVDDWSLVARLDRELVLYRIELRQYPLEGPTYRTVMLGLEPPAGRFDLDGCAERLAKAHGIGAPTWLAPSLREMVARLDQRHAERR